MRFFFVWECLIYNEVQLFKSVAWWYSTILNIYFFGKMKSIFWLGIFGAHFSAMCISLMFSFLFTMFFSTFASYLFFLEPERIPFMVYGFMGKSSGRLSFIGQRCFRFWKLDLGSSKGYLRGQRGACVLEQQHIELMLLGPDIAWVRRWMASSYVQPRATPSFLWVTQEQI